MHSSFDTTHSTRRKLCRRSERLVFKQFYKKKSVRGVVLFFERGSHIKKLARGNGFRNDSDVSMDICGRKKKSLGATRKKSKEPALFSVLKMNDSDFLICTRRDRMKACKVWWRTNLQQVQFFMSRLNF